MGTEDTMQPETLWSNRMERMCFRFLAEIPLSFIIRYLDKNGHKVILSAADTPAFHCGGCVGYLNHDPMWHENDVEEDKPLCPGVTYGE